MKLLKLFASIALGLASAPIAGAMIASVDGMTVHNTVATDYVSEIWDRTVQFSAGTGTYLGKSADGKHWVLTAAHVPVGNGTIVTSTGEVIGLSAATETPVLFYNQDGTQADLKMFSVVVEGDSEDYLNGLGNIKIHMGELTSGTSFYCVGTGVSLTMRSGLSSGARGKEWGEAVWGDHKLERKSVQKPYTGYQYTSAVFSETFSENGASIQVGSSDSGCGAFVKNGESWEMIGVAITVAPNSAKGQTIGYIENPNSVCSTNFVDLSAYATQIYTVVPEPSLFGLAAGFFALGLAGARRRR